MLSCFSVSPERHLRAQGSKLSVTIAQRLNEDNGLPEEVRQMHNKGTCTKSRSFTWIADQYHAPVPDYTHYIADTLKYLYNIHPAACLAVVSRKETYLCYSLEVIVVRPKSGDCCGDIALPPGSWGSKVVQNDVLSAHQTSLRPTQLSAVTFKCVLAMQWRLHLHRASFLGFFELLLACSKINANQ